LAESRQRLDKWLWFARMARTRTLAQKLVLAGRVRVNRSKTGDPSDPVRLDDVLTIALESGVRVLRVRDLGSRRGPPAEARLLYIDLAPPAEKPVDPPRVGARPTKRDRRALDSIREVSDGFSDDDADA
jgi:ribosome-associated heat shock protein Hsp15